MAVIKSVEKLGQLKRMFRQVSRLRSRNALAHSVRSLSGSKPQLPNLVAGWTIKISSKIRRLANILRRDAASHISTKTFRIKSTLAEDVRRPHDRVLYVRTGFTLEIQRILEVKRDHRWFGVLQHEKAQRADGNLGGDRSSVCFA